MAEILNSPPLLEFYRNDGKRRISESAERLERYRFNCIIHAIKEFQRSLPGHRLSVVDAGAGLGQLSIDLAEQGHQVTAVDCAESRLKRFEARAVELGITQVLASVQETTLQDVVADCVVCSEVVEHLPDPHEALREFSRITKKGGLLVLSVPYAEILQKVQCPDCGAFFHPHGHLHSFTLKDIRDLLETHCFEIQRTRVIAKRIAAALVRRAMTTSSIAYFLDKIQPSKPNSGWLIVAARKR